MANAMKRSLQYDCEIQVKRYKIEPRSLLDFSDCVLLKILSFLKPYDLYCLSKTCQRFKYLIAERKLWRKVNVLDHPMCARKFQFFFDNVNNSTDSILVSGISKKEKTLMFSQFVKLNKLCENVTILAIENQYINSDEIGLKDFPISLKELSLRGTHIYGRQPFLQDAHIKLEKLHTLILADCKWFHEHSLMALSKLRSLENLSLYNCANLNDSVAYMSITAKFGFRKLLRIDARCTAIGDQFLKCFHCIKTLREIYLEAPERRRRPRAPRCAVLDQLQRLAVPPGPSAVVFNRTQLFQMRRDRKTAKKHKKPATTPSNVPRDASFNCLEDCETCTMASCSIIPSTQPCDLTTRPANHDELHTPPRKFPHSFREKRNLQRSQNPQSMNSQQISQILVANCDPCPRLIHPMSFDPSIPVPSAFDLTFRSGSTTRNSQQDLVGLNLSHDSVMSPPVNSKNSQSQDSLNSQPNLKSQSFETSQSQNGLNLSIPTNSQLNSSNSQPSCSQDSLFAQSVLNSQDLSSSSSVIDDSLNLSNSLNSPLIPMNFQLNSPNFTPQSSGSVLVQSCLKSNVSTSQDCLNLSNSSNSPQIPATFQLNSPNSQPQSAGSHSAVLAQSSQDSLNLSISSNSPPIPAIFQLNSSNSQPSCSQDNLFSQSTLKSQDNLNSFRSVIDNLNSSGIPVNSQLNSSSSSPSVGLDLSGPGERTDSHGEDLQVSSGGFWAKEMLYCDDVSDTDDDDLEDGVERRRARSVSEALLELEMLQADVSDSGLLWFLGAAPAGADHSGEPSTLFRPPYRQHCTCGNIVANNNNQSNADGAGPSGYKPPPSPPPQIHGDDVQHLPTPRVRLNIIQHAGPSTSSSSDSDSSESESSAAGALGAPGGPGAPAPRLDNVEEVYQVIGRREGRDLRVIIERLDPGVHIVYEHGGQRRRAEMHNSTTQLKVFVARGYKLITNQALRSLVDLRLELLDVTGTSVTASGVKEFLMVNPDCRVIHESTCQCGYHP